MNNFIMVIPELCTGCRVCQLACMAVHSNKTAAKVVGTVNQVPARLHMVKRETGRFPIQCRQCEDAPCARSCQTKAISHKNGAVQIEESLCIGCKNCLIACPFGAMDLFHTQEECYAYKCDLCSTTSGDPACVTGCPQHALRLVIPEQYRKIRLQQIAQNSFMGAGK